MVLPLYYTMGLSMLFSHLRVGATVLLTGRNMTDPVFWKFLKEEKATSFTGVPYSFQILDMMRFYRMDLPELELLTQGGGKMPTALNEKFVNYCEQHGKRWIATYGQSECTARMAYLPAKWAREKMGSIGIAVPNGELSLIDENGNPIDRSKLYERMFNTNNCLFCSNQMMCNGCSSCGNCCKTPNLVNESEFLKIQSEKIKDM
jgi:acyl-coenzyme A synthetase/AMP-(fatty) acid ligase